MTYTTKIHNVETGEIVEREMSPEEIKIYEDNNATATE